MNHIEILLNYLDISKFLVMIIIILLILALYFILSSDLSTFSEDFNVNKKNDISAPSTGKRKKENDVNHTLNHSRIDKSIEIKGFLQNEVKASEQKFMLNEEIENIGHLSVKLESSQPGLADKNEELSIMFIESLSSLNSWKNNEVENELFRKTNWNIEKRENNGEDESVVSQYVYPQLKRKESISLPYVHNLSSSQSSINSNSETEDGEEEKEKAILSQYKLGICRTFDCCDENKIKSNIVKEVNGHLYKIFSEGDPHLIREKCRSDTIPKNFDEMMGKYEKEGYTIIGISGKKMKMNYLQSQKIERTKCESNMVFLGFVIYKVNFDGYKSAYS
jgi:hypothetical protein